MKIFGSHLLQKLREREDPDCSAVVRDIPYTVQWFHVHTPSLDTQLPEFFFFF